MNKTYARLSEGGGIDYAPSVVKIEGRMILNPSAATYKAAGWLPVADAAPVDPPSGSHYEPRGWKVSADGERIEREYILVPDPPAPPRRWSRLSIKTVLAKAGSLDAAKSYLSAAEIAAGYTAWEALTDCDYVEEGYPDAEAWDALLDGAAVALGKTRAEIDAFLAAIPTEDD